ncbi:MAG: T9SS type A sorting domain-containing protein, partial [Bacteroidetes bacterium]|nr:T9SS type A sorting domain-containing protein [Bacteroidota bacterium]
LKLKDANDQIATILVEDMYGNKIQSWKTSRSHFDLSNQSAGVYFLKVFTVTKKLLTVKLIKE